MPSVLIKISGRHRGRPYTTLKSPLKLTLMWKGWKHWNEAGGGAQMAARRLPIIRVTWTSAGFCWPLHAWALLCLAEVHCPTKPSADWRGRAFRRPLCLPAPAFLWPPLFPNVSIWFPAPLSTNSYSHRILVCSSSLRCEGLGEGHIALDIIKHWKLHVRLSAL